MLASWALRILHFLYTAIVIVASFVERIRRPQPQPLTAHRKKIPSHLSLLLVSDGRTDAAETERAFLECLQRTIAWCRATGIKTLTAYDAEGVLMKCSGTIRDHMLTLEESFEDDSTESEVEYPLTPPLSEHSVSRSNSPDLAKLPIDLNVVTIRPSKDRPHTNPVKRRNIAVRKRSPRKEPQAKQLTLHLISHESSKPAINSVAQALIQKEILKRKSALATSDYELSVPELNAILEGGLPSPEFIIIHHISPIRCPRPPLKLHGYPPWQITLSEMHRTHIDTPTTWSSLFSSPKVILLDETAFCRALDEFSGAQMRLGK
ncbi:hypothetical protein BJ138DRAFT_467827 [Hygrophoropsis aurantiaca]|uniref:Uncharacterized protein n=1 Tax=Hygrophoropsis aurantiaca TaxID=72124 RepID=A0ACB8AVH0_9AGAM|nr:hypothetical protein BJ138DRAFT_467827 [Hygrophoropsis aurantiaca]